MKRMLSQKLIDALYQLVVVGGDEWVKQMKEVVFFDDDYLVVNYPVDIGGESIRLPSISAIVNLDEDPYFPSLAGNGGKLVVINENETGFEFIPPLFKSQETIGTPAQLSVSGEVGSKQAQVQFSLSNREKERLASAKLIIFAMNGSFIITPLAQTGDTLALQSFAYNDSGNTRSVRCRFDKTNATGLIVKFDSDFAEACAFATNPYAVLIIIE